MNRRGLLIGAAGATAAAALAALSPLDRLLFHSASGGSILRGGYFYRPTSNYVPGALYSPDAATARYAFEWNIATGARKTVETTLPTHVVETHPQEPHLSILTTQKTGRSAVIDWKLSKQVASLDLPEGGFFYGHMVFSKDGSKFLALFF